MLYHFSPAKSNENKANIENTFKNKKQKWWRWW